MKMETTTKRLTITEILTPQEIEEFDDRMSFLLDEGYPLETAKSVCLDGILAKRSGEK